MSEALSWVTGNWSTILLVVTSVISGASVLVHAVAPLTSTTKDDEVASYLDKVYGWLKKLALNKDES